MTNNLIDQFLTTLQASIDNANFVRLILSNKRHKGEELKSISIKPVVIKKGAHLNFVYRFPTNDLTKNYEYTEGIEIIKDAIENKFLQGELYSTQEKWHLRLNKKNKGKLSSVKNDQAEKPVLAHDKKKHRLIDTKNNQYLKELGITNPDESVKPSMQDKYKQINKYIEIIDGVLKHTSPEKEFHICDMGSGKGYLTFALYDYLQKTLKTELYVNGIEYREELVQKCNAIAKKTGFKNLQFEQGSIKDANISQINMLIALHACDTATDDAIYRGIKANAEIIICAPCCHKQIRKQMNPSNELNLITQFGILKERQSEILTDTIRSQILEAYGYKTKVFEFISTEHTPKNVMIVATKQNKTDTIDSAILKNIETLKAMHGVEFHYLEKLLNE